MNHSRPIIFALVLVSASLASVATSRVSAQSQPGDATVADIALQSAAPDALSGTVFFSATRGVRGFELFKSNGTPEGTVLVKDINPSGPSTPGGLTNVGGTLFFGAFDGVRGGLWKSDGTGEGTVLVK